MNPQEFEMQFNEAMRMREAGSYDTAVRVLSSLLDVGDHQRAVTGMLGLILYYDMRDAQRALPFLQKAVVLSPHSEKASLGLFHALLALGRVDDAFAEATRYLREHTSDAYEEFLKDVPKP